MRSYLFDKINTLGKPVVGVISKLCSIPAGYEIIGQRGNYLGAVITGIVIDGFKRQNSRLV